MRDGSYDDTAAIWIARAIERASWSTDNHIYLALVGHAAEKHLEANTCPTLGPIEVAKLEKLLRDILDCLPKSAARNLPDENEGWRMPRGIFWQKLSPEKFEQRFAYYWTTDQWRHDFLSALEDQFWAYKDYAHGAEQGKMAFLREFAEVWIAAATTALVRYADDDKRTWQETAKLLRRHADMVEADGLRALPWGHWGQYSPPAAQSKATPETSNG